MAVLLITVHDYYTITLIFTSLLSILIHIYVMVIVINYVSRFPKVSIRYKGNVGNTFKENIVLVTMRF